MNLPEIVDFARQFSLLVRIHGPDPKGLKMKNHAFHHYHSGKTTLSASGILLPQNLRSSLNLLDNENCSNGAVVVTISSVIEPFMSQKSPLPNTEGVLELIPGAQIDVMVEAKGENNGSMEESRGGHPNWFRAHVLRLVDIPESSAAIESLIEASSGSLEHSWEIGWSLAANIDSRQRSMDVGPIEEKNDIASLTESEKTSLGQSSSKANQLAMVATRVAFLQVPTLLDKDLPEVVISPFSKRGDNILSVGSPFGILSPIHFFNSIAVGSIANTYPPKSLDKSLLMADIRCLPGMEGGPTFGPHACLIGILTRPLRQTGGAEIQVIIPWKAIEGACNRSFQPRPQNSPIGMRNTRTEMSNRVECCAASNCVDNKLMMSHFPPPFPLEQTMPSICLITLDSGVWASGVILNKQGLILTNAHLLEPWRFGRSVLKSSRDENRTPNLFTLFENPVPLRDAVVNNGQVLRSVQKGHGSDHVAQVHRKIRVRIDLENSWVWCDAKVVYVSRGPLDISLLQLESFPPQLCPITVDLSCPSPGSHAFIVGHGLLGPRCDMFPSICSGVVAKVVKAKRALVDLSSLHEDYTEKVPVMLETTASVHPGGSGGAVVNSSGHMIGLVTSNAKHGGGTVIPHMNFSIPSAALESVFLFAKDMQNMSLLQQLDKPNDDLASLWAMLPPISPDSDLFPPGVNDLLAKDKEKESKGSRFARFINQRQELLRKPRYLNTTEDLSRDTIPSKL